MLKKTPLYARHVALGAKIIDFGGFEMPVQYEGIRSEHLAVRNAAGLFDVSHMGEFFVSGPHALALINHVTINDASVLTPGKAQYTAMCHPDGGVVDDLLVYCLAEEHYLLVVNASNIEKDWNWINSHNSVGADLQNRSDEFALIALQGPESVALLQALTKTSIDAIPFYAFETGDVAGQQDVLISATGYTGEKGFELYVDTTKADPVVIWDALVEAGAVPAGLGARDTLRLEMGYALYGNDLSDTVTALEGRLGWLTKLSKAEFVGREALLKQKEDGLHRIVVGFEMEEPRKIPRHGYPVFDAEGMEIGHVTSGSLSIMSDKGIGMALVSAGFQTPGQRVFIGIRNQHEPATITRPPFYKKSAV